MLAHFFFGLLMHSIRNCDLCDLFFSHKLCLSLYQWFALGPPLLVLVRCGGVDWAEEMIGNEICDDSCCAWAFRFLFFFVSFVSSFIICLCWRRGGGVVVWSHSLIMYLPCMVTKRERRCVGTCPFSDFDDFGAFSTWMDLTILDCVRLGANFTWNRYECLLSVFFLSFSSPSFVLLTVSIVASRLTQHKFPIFVADDLSSTSQCLRHFQNVKVH